MPHPFFTRCKSMRVYRQIILVAVLTMLLVAAGVGWMRYYVSPLADEAAGMPEPRDEMSDDLPAACLDELAAMDSSSAVPATHGFHEILP